MTKDNSSIIAKMRDSVNKKYAVEGSVRDIAYTGSDMPPIEYIPTSIPMLGYALGHGGWPRGKLIEFFGPEHAGKSVLMVKALLDCWEYEERSRPIAIVDMEHRGDDMEWAKLLGLPMEDTLVMSPMGGEAGADILLDIVRSNDYCAVGFDSIGAVMPMKMHETFDDQNSLVGGKAGLVTRMVTRLVSPANLNGTTVFLTNQLRADMEGYHRPMTGGGHALKHLTSVRLYVRPSSDKFTVKDPDTGKPLQVGFAMGFKPVKNYGSPPLKQTFSNFYYRPSELFDGVGFDVDLDLQLLALYMGLIDHTGNTYSYGSLKAVGKEKFMAALSGEPELRQQLLVEVRKRMSTDSVDLSDITPELAGPDIDDAEV